MSGARIAAHRQYGPPSMNKPVRSFFMSSSVVWTISCRSRSAALGATYRRNLVVLNLPPPTIAAFDVRIQMSARYDRAIMHQHRLQVELLISL